MMTPADPMSVKHFKIVFRIASSNLFSPVLNNSWRSGAFLLNRRLKLHDPPGGRRLLLLTAAQAPQWWPPSRSI